MAYREGSPRRELDGRSRQEWESCEMKFPVGEALQRLMRDEGPEKQRAEGQPSTEPPEGLELRGLVLWPPLEAEHSLCRG